MPIVGLSRFSAEAVFCFFCGKVRVAHPMDCCAKCGELRRQAVR